jgi:cobyrinic acid a,c-diamide synthase
MAVVQCHALFISAPASGQGKTTVTAALARLHRNAGREVRVFKTGPDFIDPTILAHASGHPVYNLDLWLVGEERSKALLAEAAKEADIILIEGVMGLFDGDPSSADLAERFGIPVLAVIDASAMAQTFAALAHGIQTYRPSLPFAGVLANRVGSERHGEILKTAINDDERWYGAIPRDESIGLPSRHLGLHLSQEVSDLDERLTKAADHLSKTSAAILPPLTQFHYTDDNNLDTGYPLKDTVIAVARDSAFCFVYADNMRLLKQLGAQLVYFSPLEDAVVPEADALYLPGGYPELYAEQLSNNASMKASIHYFVSTNKPVIAECGGMLYLANSLTNKAGQRFDMLGIIPGEAVMQTRLVSLALQSVLLPEGLFRGHTYHHSNFTTALSPVALGECPNYRRTAESVFRQGNVLASYIHFYFPSSPAACVALFKR